MVAGRALAQLGTRDRAVEQLEQAAAELGRFVGEDVPRPERWGGYRLCPVLWEFWQHRADRLHDRFRYRPGDGGWIVERLAP